MKVSLHAVRHSISVQTKEHYDDDLTLLVFVKIACRKCANKKKEPLPTICRRRRRIKREWSEKKLLFANKAFTNLGVPVFDSFALRCLLVEGLKILFFFPIPVCIEYALYR